MRSATRTALFWIVAIILSVLAGFAVSAGGLLIWDDWALYAHSIWTLHIYGLGSATMPVSPNAIWIATLWPLILGIGSEYLFGWLHDPFAVRHALTFALFPLLLVWLWRFLRRHGVPKAASFLTVAMLIGHIRLGGHAALSLRDFPHAAGFLVAVLLSWELLWDIRRRGYPERRLIALGAVGTLPFLLRSPNVLPLPVIIVALGIIACSDRSLPWKRRLTVIGLPAVTGLLLGYIGSPALWVAPHKILHPLQLFSAFPWQDQLQVMGIPVNGADPPLWYYPVWLFVGIEPVTFLCLLVGLALLCVRTLRRRHTEWTPELWIGIITLLTWTAVMVIRPHDYDEDRHLLFLYPPLVVLAGMGLRYLPRKLQLTLAAAIIASATWSYVVWRAYSYVYKSPLVPRREAAGFQSDYRGVCLNEMTRRLPEFVPEDADITVMQLPRSEMKAQTERLERSLLAQQAGYPRYVFTGSGSRLAIAGSKRGLIPRLLGEARYEAKPLLILTIPPYGEPACALVTMKVR